MEQQGHEEETGKAKITPAFNLPCRYVLHTVGLLSRDGLQRKDKELLASCYRSCLELAEKNNLRNIAFCCISTGEFHFPNDKAAQIAIQTVKEYRQETHTKMEVIFNVFKDEITKSTVDSSGQIEQLRKELAQTDAVVIGAGAGLSTSAGFVYSGERFRQYFSDFEAKYGFHDMYSGGFYPYATPEEHWAYWSRYIYINRYMDAPKPVYDNLFELVKSKGLFCYHNQCGSLLPESRI